MKSVETQCKGKRRYRRRRDARRALRRHQTSEGGNTIELYLCPHCGWWHLGNNRRRAS